MSIDCLFGNTDPPKGVESGSLFNEGVLEYCGLNFPKVFDNGLDKLSDDCLRRRIFGFFRTAFADFGLYCEWPGRYPDSSGGPEGVYRPLSGVYRSVDGV